MEVFKLSTEFVEETLQNSLGAFSIQSTTCLKLYLLVGALCAMSAVYGELEDHVAVVTELLDLILRYRVIEWIEIFDFFHLLGY